MKIVNITTFDSFIQLYNQYKSQQQKQKSKEDLHEQSKNSAAGSFEDINRDQINQLPSLTTPSTSNEYKNLILYFVADNAPGTKQSWCSDCRDSQPLIEKTIENFQFNDQLSLAIICVGDKEEWKKSDNPYRRHELAITALPTLISLKSVSSPHFRLSNIKCYLIFSTHALVSESEY